MIITKTPFRMSFFGGGTDIPEFFNEYGGAVISTTIDKYCYATVRHLPRFFEYNDSIVYAKIEKVKKVDDISHPLVREAMKYLDMHELSINYDADLPARTGLGSSSAFADSLLLAFHDLKGKFVDKRTLAKEAIYVERVLCGEAGGWQDQIASSFGGLNRIDFNNDDFYVHPIIIFPERKRLLENNLLMFFTGFSRLSSEIQEDTEKNMKANTENLRYMYSLVDVAEKVLTDKAADMDDFGRLLDDTWQRKRLLGSKVSTEKIDEIYSEAISAGALGGKLLGAGGGGFLLFYVPQDRQKAVKERLNRLLYIPFGFENIGAETLYYRPEEYELLEEPMD